MMQNLGRPLQQIQMLLGRTVATDPLYNRCWHGGVRRFDTWRRWARWATTWWTRPHPGGPGGQRGLFSSVQLLLIGFRFFFPRETVIVVLLDLAGLSPPRCAEETAFYIYIQTRHLCRPECLNFKMEDKVFIKWMSVGASSREFSGEVQRGISLHKWPRLDTASALVAITKIMKFSPLASAK